MHSCQLIAFLLAVLMGFADVASAGDLQVTIRNVNGSTVSGAEVRLYTVGWSPYLPNPARFTNASGVATFSGLPAGTYHCEAYYNGTGTVEFWGSSENVTVPATGVAARTIQRYWPYITSFNVPSGTQSGSVSLSISVRNNVSQGIMVRVRLWIDDNAASPYVLNALSPSDAIPANGTRTFTFSNITLGAGSYQWRAHVESLSSSTFIPTDTRPWAPAWTVPTPPTPPAAAVPISPCGATLPGNSATMSWNAPSTGTQPITYDTELALSSSFSPVVQSNSGLSTTSWTISNLQWGTSYWWRVRARNSAGTSGWQACTFTTAGASLHLTVRNQNNVITPGAQVRLKTLSGTWLAAVSTDSSGVATWSGLQSSATPYDYEVYYNGTGVPEFWGNKTVVVAGPTTSASFTRFWPYSSASSVPTGSQVLPQTVSITVTNSVPAAVAANLPVRVRLWINATQSVPAIYDQIREFNVLALSPHTFSFQGINLPPGSYSWRMHVLTFNQGAGGYIETDTRAWAPAWSVPPLSAPTGLAPCGQQLSTSNVTMSWTPPAGGPYTYDVELSTDQQFVSVHSQVNGLTGTSWAQLNLAPQTQFWWRVRTRTVASVSGWASCTFHTGVLAQPHPAMSVEVFDRNDFGQRFGAPYPEQYRRYESPSFAFFPIDTVVVKCRLTNTGNIPMYLGVAVTATAGAAATQKQWPVRWTSAMVPAGEWTEMVLEWDTLETVPAGGKAPGLYDILTTVHANLLPATSGAASGNLVTPAAFRVLQPSISLCPVVLIHGWRGSADAFGDLERIIETGEGGIAARPVRRLLYPTAPDYPDVSCRDIAGVLGAFLQNCRYHEQSGATGQVDIIAHSMGGLIATVYLSGESSVGPNLGSRVIAGEQSLVRRLVTLGSPLAGGTVAHVPGVTVGLQIQEMKDASALHWDLSDRRWDFLKAMGGGSFGSRVLNVVGVAGQDCPLSDGIIASYGASHGYASPSASVLVVSAVHSHSDFGGWASWRIGCAPNTNWSLNGFQSAAGPMQVTHPAAVGLLSSIVAYLDTGVLTSGGLSLPSEGMVAVRLRNPVGQVVQMGSGVLSLWSGGDGHNVESGTRFKNAAGGDVGTTTINMPGYHQVQFPVEWQAGAVKYFDVLVQSWGGPSGSSAAFAIAAGALNDYRLKAFLQNADPGARFALWFSANLPPGPAPLVAPDNSIGLGLGGAPWDSLFVGASGDAYLEVSYDPAVTGRQLHAQWGTLNMTTWAIEVGPAVMVTL